MAKITAVIPAWNKWELTLACLESLERTTSRDELEILVVDNGSVDSTPSQLERLAKDGRLRYLRNDENRGFAVATNQGIQESPGDVLLLNNDIVALPGWFKPLATAIGSSAVSGAGSLLLYPNQKWIQHAGVGVGYLKGKLKVWHHFQYRPVEQNPEARDSCDYLALTAACLLLKRSELDRVGLLDEGFRNGYEDVDLCLRITTTGGRLRYCGNSELIHHESVTTGRHHHEMENRQRFFSRWTGVAPSKLANEQVWAALNEAGFRRDLIKGELDSKHMARLAKIVRARGESGQADLWQKIAGKKWFFWYRKPADNESAHCLERLGYGDLLNGEAA